MIGKITGSTVGKNKDGDTDVLLLQVEISEDDDLQTVELVRQAGEDYNPPEGSTVVILPVTQSDKVGVATDDGIAPEVSPGERELYSSVAGAKMATIKLALDGGVELNGNTDFAVKYSGFATFASTIVAELNALIALYNAHLPTPITPAQPSVAGALVPLAKSTTVKVPLV
jgi:phage gp45-like